ncbi:MAG: hypothetical protein JWP01_3801 [Myxococcales bacterium]|nr:hypothetical protein [Myxococcales bacterium]
MSERVNAKRVAVGAGVLVALYVITSFVARPVPDSIVSLLGGPSGIERDGGLRVHYRPSAGEVQVIEYPRIAETQIPDVLDLLVGGGLSMREALESDYAKRTGISEGDYRNPDPTKVTLEGRSVAPGRG